ncbi:MAG: hypothetical protein ACPH03_06775 [Flavobacteriaceae bacterium]
MKKILGLDLGTNSIGWALVNHNFRNKESKILGMGSRIIPMSKNELDDFARVLFAINKKEDSISPA